MADDSEKNVRLPAFGDVPVTAGIIVLVALGILIAIKRGFRGIEIGVS